MIKEWLVHAVQSFPPELATVLLAALPVTEMRASIPLAMTAFGMPALPAVLYSVLGNLLPIPFLLCLLPVFVAFAERHIPPLHRLMERYFAHVKKRHGGVDVMGGVALGLVAVLPLPGAGIWTGCVLAVLFRIPPRVSVPALVGGAIFESVIIFLITTGTLGALRWLL